MTAFLAFTPLAIEVHQVAREGIGRLRLLLRWWRILVRRGRRCRVRIRVVHRVLKRSETSSLGLRFEGSPPVVIGTEQLREIVKDSLLCVVQLIAVLAVCFTFAESEIPGL